MKTDRDMLRMMLAMLFAFVLLPAGAQYKKSDVSIVGNKNIISIDHGLDIAMAGTERPSLRVISTRMQYTRMLTDYWGVRTGIGVTERVEGRRVYFFPLKACLCWNAAPDRGFLNSLPLNFELNAGINMGWVGKIRDNEIPVHLPTEEYYFLNRDFYTSLEAGTRVSYNLMEHILVLLDLSIGYNNTRNYSWHSTNPYSVNYNFRPAWFGYMSGGVAVSF